MVNEMVSVIVISYNSIKYIKDTLESIKLQDYPNIELIICDDCSSDGTLEFAEKWINNNKNTFTRVILLPSTENRGVVDNINKGYMNAKGKWLKPIAADDILAPNCISANVSNAIESSRDVIFSRIKYFTGDINNAYNPDISYDIFSLSRQQKLSRLLRDNEIPCTPSVFFSSMIIEKVGFCDKRFPMIEDYPLWVKILSHGFDFGFFNEYTVYYRQENSLTRYNNRFINPVYLMSLEKFYKIELFPKYQYTDCMFYFHKKLYFTKCHAYIDFFNNKVTLYSRVLLFFLNIIDPYYYKELVSQIIRRK